MGSFIELNDTLKISRQQGFPIELNYQKHISVENGFYTTEQFKDKIFEFKDKSDIRIYKIPPVRNFLVEYTPDGKWLYWGMCHILEINHDYINRTTSGKFKIIYINTPDEMKKSFELIDRAWGNDYFNRKK